MILSHLADDLLTPAPGACAGHQPGALRWVDGAAGGDVWAVGNWHRFYTNETDDLLDASLQWTAPGPFSNHPNPAGSTVVWLSPSGTVWTMASGAVSTWDGAAWTVASVTPPSGQSFVGITGSSDSDVYVLVYPNLSSPVANQIQYYHWDGAAWTLVTVGMGHPARTFYPLDPRLTSDGVLRCGGRDQGSSDPDFHSYGFIARLTGGSPGVEYRATENNNSQVSALYMDSASHGYAAGYWNSLNPALFPEDMPITRIWEYSSGAWAPIATQVPFTGHDPTGTVFSAWYTRIYATDSSNLWVVGYYEHDGGTPGYSNILVWQWNGSAWTEHTFPDYADPTGSGGPQVSGVWSSAASDTWIVGHCVTQADGIEHQFAHYWNGTTWIDRTLPDEGPQPPP